MQKPTNPAPVPLAATASEEDLVPLDPDHPGFRDPVYRARRNAIASIGKSARDGEPAPRVEYTEEEHQTWRTVWTHLAPMHERYACPEFYAGLEKVNIDRQRIPQLADVNEILKPHTGFQLRPVAGLVSARTFFEFLGRRLFLSTQYIRHASTPLYTPEPDVVHEVVGHAATLANPLFADLNGMAGQAVSRLKDEDVLRLERVYWYTLEFGVVDSPQGVKAYGAGLLSSFGELGRFEKEANLRPLDLDEAAATEVDPTRYQDTLFVAKDLETMRRDLVQWLNALG